MFNLNPAQSNLTNGVQGILSKLGEYKDAASLQPFVQALQGSQKVEEMKLGLEVAKEEVGWRVFSDNNQQMAKFVSQA